VTVRDEDWENVITDRLCARDESALKEFSSRYYRIALDVAARITPDRGSAEEAVNDSLLRLWNALGSCRPGNLGRYFLTVVRNTALLRAEHERRQKRDITKVSGLDAAAVPGEAPRFEPPEDGNESLTSFVRSFLDSLRPGDADVFVERYWYGKTPEEIARERSCPVKKIYNKLFRLKDRFAKAYKEFRDGR
jgi:RNA polymerase sigma factor (sigma-70 family)